MKRFFLFLISVLLLLPFSSAHAQTDAWVIRSFQSEIFIPKNGKVQVTETIAVDFKATPKHGIFRTIPTQGVRLDLKKVTQDGNSAQVEVTSSSQQETIRIGDPDITLTGPHAYVISYEVGRVITRFSDHDEFYWNATGNDWEAPIAAASARVTLAGAGITEVACYTGPLGSQEQNCAAFIKDEMGEFITSSLSSGEGLTVVNSLPAGWVADPLYLDDLVRPYWLIIGSLFAVALVIRSWWRHGRDLWYKTNVIDDPSAKEGIKPLFAHQTVVAEFEPPQKLRPGEVGTLVDERVDIHDISATLVDLAVRGYIQIQETKKLLKSTYRFTLKKIFTATNDLAAWERAVLEGVFGKEASVGEEVALADLQEKFYTHLPDIKKKLYTKLTTDGYFPKPPDEVQKQQITRAFIWMVGTGLAGYLLAQPVFKLWWVPMPVLLFALLSLVSAPLMPRKSGKGTEAVRRAAGFKLFVSTAQKYQQQFNEKINYFDVYLPYAMVFGVVGKWVGAFKALGIEPPQPSWYVGPGPFNIINFSSSVNAMESSFSSTLPSRPASQGGSGMGGGGFSGGGFGGGGGGSW